MKTHMILAMAALAALPAGAPAQGAVLGDVSACEVGDMPAIQVGGKDGRLVTRHRRVHAGRAHCHGQHAFARGKGTDQ